MPTLSKISPYTGSFWSNLKSNVKEALSSCNLLEKRCVFCGMPFQVPLHKEKLSSLEKYCCSSCYSKFKRREKGYCPHCGQPLLSEDSQCVPCDKCSAKLPPWNNFFFYGVHEGALRESMLRGKFGSDLTMLKFLGELLSELCLEKYAQLSLPDFIIPMPIHRKRLQERGYNQCVELGRILSKKLAIPMKSNLLKREVYTPPQAQQSAAQRSKLGNVFSVHGDINGQEVMLLDDVCTTGATMRRATECLFLAGVSRVDVVVVARA